MWMDVGAPYVLYVVNCPIAEQLHNTQRCRVHLNMGLQVHETILCAERTTSPWVNDMRRMICYSHPGELTTPPPSFIMSDRTRITTLSIFSGAIACHASVKFSLTDSVHILIY